MKKIAFGLIAFIVLTAVTHKTNTYEMNGNELVLPVPITFNFISTAPQHFELTKESDSALNHIKNYLNDKPYVTTLRIEGHTSSDFRTDDFARMNASKQQALLVGQWLNKNGVDCKRLICVGFGSSKPIQSNDTPEGKAANNRITVVNAALRKVPIGGFPLDGGGQNAGDPCK